MTPRRPCAPGTHRPKRCRRLAHDPDPYLWPEPITLTLPLTAAHNPQPATRTRTRTITPNPHAHQSKYGLDFTALSKAYREEHHTYTYRQAWQGRVPGSRVARDEVELLRMDMHNVTKEDLFGWQREVTLEGPNPHPHLSPLTLTLILILILTLTLTLILTLTLTSLLEWPLRSASSSGRKPARSARSLRARAPSSRRT